MSARPPMTADAAPERDDDGVLFADGFDDAFLGVCRQFNTAFAVYDRAKCLAILRDRGMTAEEADEHFDFNVGGAYVGPHTPAFIDLMPIAAALQIDDEQG